MLFSSIIFIFGFLPVFISIYIFSGMRTAILLLGSVFFYTWGEGPYVLLLGCLIIFTYISANYILKFNGKKKLVLFSVAVAVDLGALILFKYVDFVTSNLSIIFPSFGLKPLGLKLPLGISFFTFQLLSYLFDVYRGEVRRESSLARFATYILMFPHLIAGPIVRYKDIQSELSQRERSADRFGLGVQYFVIGLCQKVLIANSLAPMADHAFLLDLAVASSGDAWLGIVAYSLQIYFDFCGYSNMAIGLAFMLGFTFPRNFDYPYSAKSISDFWRRWHMSLSFWFRDYVYIPLGGNKRGNVITIRNLLVVFFLTGLWHGAAWNFIFWGLFHGGLILLERFWLGKYLLRIHPAIQTMYAIFMVMIGWVFFRATDFPHAIHYIGAMFSPSHWGMPSVGTRVLLSPEVIVIYCAAIALAFHGCRS
jgi:alginate O-acetyltransferase complex protein AlgI